MYAMRPTWLQSRQSCKMGYCRGGGNARKRNQVHFAIVALGDKTAKQGRQDAEVSIFVRKIEMAEALPLVLTSSSGRGGLPKRWTGCTSTRSSPTPSPHGVLWDSAYVSREYLGVCNDEGVLDCPTRMPTRSLVTSFDVASLGPHH